MADIEAVGTAPHRELLCEFRQGSTTGPLYDVTGWTAAVDFRAHPDDADAVLECTEDDGRIEWDREASRVYLLLSADDLALLKGSEAHFDVRIERPDENPWIPRRGRIRVTTPITR